LSDDEWDPRKSSEGADWYDWLLFVFFVVVMTGLLLIMLANMLDPTYPSRFSS